MAGADYLMFTGSTASGRQIARDAGERLIGASLELGGKNAMVVLADADIEKAAAGAVAACFPSAGQLCVSVERLYVADEIHDAFVAAFVERTRAMRLGAAYDFSMDMGSLTTPSQLETVSAHVGDAVSKGATVLAGGRARPDLGPLFYEPTMVAMANATPYGLNASVWGRNGAEARKVARRLHAGTVNEAFAAAWGSIDAPMGGMGDSGLGRRHGADGLLKYTEAQTVAHQRLQGFNPPRGIEHEQWARLLTRAFKMLRALGVR